MAGQEGAFSTVFGWGFLMPYGMAGWPDGPK